MATSPDNQQCPEISPGNLARRSKNRRPEVRSAEATGPSEPGSPGSLGRSMATRPAGCPDLCEGLPAQVCLRLTCLGTLKQSCALPLLGRKPGAVRPRGVVRGLSAEPPSPGGCRRNLTLQLELRGHRATLFSAPRSQTCSALVAFQTSDGAAAAASGVSREKDLSHR